MDTATQTVLGEVRWQSAALTDTGRKRAQNEDAILALPEHGVFCVADGLGGARFGAMASGLVVDAVRRSLATHGPEDNTVSARRPAVVRDAIVQANLEILDHATRNDAQGMGSTVVMLIVEEGTPLRGTILNVGDSRAYRFRGGQLEQLTRDHSLAAEAGLPDRSSLPVMFRNLITRAIGVKSGVEIDTVAIEIQPDDVLLLCSDGLYGMVSDANLGRLIAEDRGRTPEQLAARLVHTANLNGGTDNISVIVVRFFHPAPADVDTEPITVERVLPPVSGTPAEHQPVRPSGGLARQTAPSATAGTRAVKTAAMVAAAALLGGWGGYLAGGHAPDASAPADSRPVPPPPVAVEAGVAAYDGAAVTQTAPRDDAGPALTVEIQDLRKRVAELQEVVYLHNRCQGKVRLAHDIRKALTTGRWGALGERIALWQTRDAAFMDDVSGAEWYAVWHREWQRVATGALNPSNEYARLCRQARRILPEPIAVAIPEPQWEQDATNNANLYCRHRCLLEQRILDAVRAADEQPQQE